ncbi:unnamed protein product [Pleuronectes platessa]|uniref:BED-type domain-containing protein n=1 Tax=Pleuronectes platessa TaxID=8262 RepID=A0A9N7VZ69_PLEPL|nr:unnamed protein product [Pleuronectes platessa]
MEAARPKIIKFGFKDYIVDENKKKRTAVCKVCSSKISDTIATTSNFIRHYKTHKKRYEEYIHTKDTLDLKQPSINQFIESRSVPLYNCNHPQQKAITHSILSDLIINCNMPLSIVEHQSFHQFLSIVDNKYSPVSRRTITSKIDSLVGDRQTALLDPSFGTMWLAHDVLAPENVKEDVSVMIKSLILRDAGMTMTTTSPITDEPITPSEPERQTGLFSAYRKNMKMSSNSTPQIQLNHYLDICDGQSCLQFWAMNRRTLPSLFKVARAT